jgi:hypothetical protein
MRKKCKWLTRFLHASKPESDWMNTGPIINSQVQLKKQDESVDSLALKYVQKPAKGQMQHLQIITLIEDLR